MDRKNGLLAENDSMKQKSHFSPFILVQNKRNDNPIPLPGQDGKILALGLTNPALGLKPSGRIGQPSGKDFTILPGEGDRIGTILPCQ